MISTTHEFEDDPDTDTFQAAHEFEGCGLTAAVEVLIPSSYYGISAFAKSRASFLYGESDFVAVNGDKDARLANANDDDLISIGELQIGLDWRCCLANGGTFFVTLAAEGQYWSNAGTGGPTNNAPFDEGNYQNANPQDADLGFFGLSIGTGLTF